MRLLTSGEMCEVLGGLHFQTLNSWILSGEVPTLLAGRGKGSRRVFSFSHAFAASVRLELAKLIDRKTARAVAALVGSLPDDELHANFAAGRQYVMVLDGEVCPVMGSREEFYGAENAAMVQAAAADGVDVRPTLIDLVPIWQQTKQRIESLN